MKMPIILIDNGHGKETPGKRSPDGSFREYRYAREIAAGIASVLTIEGYSAFLLVKEEEDVPLKDRVERVKAYCRHYGTTNVILVSVHVNAAANSGWQNARGWSVYTSPGVTESDKLATALHAAAVDELEKGSYKETFAAGKQKPVRSDWSDGDPDWEAAFYMLTKTPCVAVLTENLFQDNKEDVEFLRSDAGKGAIINLHVEGIERYLKSKK